MASSCAGAIEHVTRRAWLACLLLTACDVGEGRVECRFGPEHIVVRSAHRVFDSLALVARDGGAVALWSDPSGLYARQLDPHGAGRAAAVRVGDRCEGGIDAIAHGDGVAVACLRRGAGGDDGRAVSLRTLGADLSVVATTHFGRAGVLSRGVALAAEGAAWHVAWLDASAETNRVWLARVQDGSPPGARVISDESREAGVPDLVVADGAPVAVFREAFLQQGQPAAELVMVAADGSRRRVVGLHHEHASPRLSALGDDLYVVYRDRRRRGERIGLYVARMSGGRIVRPGPVRAARADGDAMPALSTCFGGLVASTPRTFAGDYFVGVSWFGAGPTTPMLEQQFYEDAHEFTDTAAACLGDEALLLIGERGRLAQKETTLRAATFACTR